MDLKPWPPSARHHHGFMRTHLYFDRLYKGSIEAYVDGQRADGNRVLFDLYDQRKAEWMEWWEENKDDVIGHPCLPPYRCVFTAMYEIYILALEEGVDTSIITG